ncbi:MAG: hypothetical protein CUN55_16795, partial [Phototrophicales bacterium]
RHSALTRHATDRPTMNAHQPRGVRRPAADASVGTTKYIFRCGSIINRRPNNSIKPTKLHTDFVAYATERADILRAKF